MSDMQKWLKKKSSSKEIKVVEGHERAEGVRDALKSGKGDAVAGAKRLRMKKTGLASAEKMGEKRMRKK